MSNMLMGLTDFYGIYNKLAAKEVVLDVRKPEEYSAGHIPNSLNIPLDQVESRIDELKNYDTVYIHCKRGGRAKTAYDLLVSKGRR